MLKVTGLTSDTLQTPLLHTYIIVYYSIEYTIQGVLTCYTDSRGCSMTWTNLV